MDRRNILGLGVLGALGLGFGLTRPGQAAQAGERLPEFQGISNWLNSQPLSVNDLRGKVVAVQFWTLGCINCQRTLPSVVSLYSKYADKGLVIVGVHTPEFPFERELKNVQAAIKQRNIAYPVAVDNGFKTWRAYNNEYWPHLFIADRKGILRYDHIGEGAYDENERVVKKLLAEA
ncbi:redoxin domain-containing protein [Anthocerotibacter panamensis]|uniref:redoxin domain-containing protein n=1 Tax=Anthocerotibacter panamensis TaxID=2857077 RepID=UPI001C402B40|nr:redoxin domain-containing protein [Anthocerotibacter panamensis]